MSLHSIDHIDDNVSDRAYKGYHIDEAGEVTEFYDHRDEEPSVANIPPSSYQPPPTQTNGYHRHAPTESGVSRARRHKDAGCCNCCVGMLTTIGTLPIGTAIATVFCLLGTALFVAGGWNALDQSMALFAELGPVDGNPKTDEPPQCRLNPAGTFTGVCELESLKDLGNRVPQVFDAIKFSFYGIIPFMLIFIIILAWDSQYGLNSLKKLRFHNCKTSSAGICVTASLIVCCYVVMLAWIFWLCFTTLGIYYYRIVMLRCYDLNDREFSSGVLSSVCLDLVQLGIIMFQDTNDEGFGKFCGPGTSQSPTYGNLVQYCKQYYPVYNYMIMTFIGCMLIIIGMVNFIVILTGNYTALTHKFFRSHKSNAPSYGYSAAPSTIATSLPPASVPGSSYVGPTVHVRGTRDRSYPDDDSRRYRSSKDIEMDYLIDGESSVAMPRRRDLDSNVGLNYYYRDRPKY